MSIDPKLVCTTNDVPGHKIISSFGVVRGISVRSRSVVGNMLGGIQALFGGNISVYQQLCEQARYQAFDIMVRHAERLGANAMVAVRYDANEIMSGITEVLAYGTAVCVEKVSP
jgi:uncharacterized protein YbjQ (UPF0145 family)